MYQFVGNNRFAIYALGVLISLSGATVRADALDSALLSTEGKKIHAYLRKHNSKVVGVLPFQTQRGKEEWPRFDPTPLSTTLVPRLERLLTLVQGSEAKYRVLQGCSIPVRAAKLPAWTEAPQRSRYFSLRYTPVWGPEAGLKADVFLVGVAQLSADWKTTRVVVQAFHASAPAQLQTVCTLEVRNTPELLASHGISFRTKGPAPTGQTFDIPDPVIPLMPPDPPMPGDPPVPPEQKPPVQQHLEGFDLEIFYSGKPLKLDQTQQSQKEVPVPAAGDRLTFNMKNSSKERLIVLLRVNGRNIFNQEVDDPSACLKFVIEPGKERRVDGFVMTDPNVGGKSTILDIVARVPENLQALQVSTEEPMFGTIETFVYRESKFAGPIDRGMSLLRQFGLLTTKGARPRTLEEAQTGLLKSLAMTSRKGVDNTPVFLPDETEGKQGKDIEIISTKNKDFLLYQCYRYRYQ